MKIGRYNTKWSGIAVTALLIIGGLGINSFSTYSFSTNASSAQKDVRLPKLSVVDDQVVRTDTGESIMLVGAVSDYFRHWNENISLTEELEVVDRFQKAGGNIIGLYLSDWQKIQERITDLDRYIAFAGKADVYVYLMPVARDFNGVLEQTDTTKQNNTFKDLQELMDTLSSRYADEPHVLYGFGAEPTKETFLSWNQKQETLAKIVRENNSDALMLITTPQYFSSPHRYQYESFPYENVVYYGGGYLGENEKNVRRFPERTRRRINLIVRAEFARQKPYIAGEFGGYWGGDFSNEQDLALIQEIQRQLNENEIHYTMYRLHAVTENGSDPLSLYNKNGNITERGEVFKKALRQSQVTQFNTTMKREE